MQRAIREKRSVEIEIKNSQDQFVVETKRFHSMTEQNQKFLRLAEREKEEATTKLER